jgi:hypothetical protein
MSDYQILLDEPAGRPALRFDEYARAFAAITGRDLDLRDRAVQAAATVARAAGAILASLSVTAGIPGVPGPGALLHRRPGQGRLETAGGGGGPAAPLAVPRVLPGPPAVPGARYLNAYTLQWRPTAVENLWPELAGTPPAFYDYLGSLGPALLDAPSLDPYLHSIDATESTHPGLVDGYRVLGDLRGLLRDLAGTPVAERRRELQSDFTEQLPGLLSVLARLPGSGPANRLQTDVEELVRRLEAERAAPVTSGSADDDPEGLDTWHRSAADLLVHIQARLREIRQTVAVGPAP